MKLKGEGGKDGLPVNIKVTVVSGDKFDVDVINTDTIGQLREKISEKMKHPAAFLRLIISGRELKDDTVIIKQARIIGQMLFVTKKVDLKNEDGGNNGGSGAGNTGSNKKTSKGQTPPPAVITEQDEAIFPSRILSKQEYFDQLFQLLNLDELAQRVYTYIYIDGYIHALIFGIHLNHLLNKSFPISLFLFLLPNRFGNC